MKKALYLIIFIILVTGIILFVQTDKVVENPDIEIPVDSPEITYTNSSADLITVELPFPGAVVGKEFWAIGEARGTWYFEASFPIDVLDKDGNILAQTYATARGEWMTENFVPFKSEPIIIPDTYIGPATLVLKKDNASGLPEHDASISFPIVIEY